MDVFHFLRERTRFVAQLYDTSVKPYLEIIRKIEAEEDPFVPPYSEEGEPPFLAEWAEAQASINLLGAACLSMLSDSLKLYFVTWARQLKLDCKKETKKGFLHGYLACFQKNTQIDLNDCPADLNIVEQVTLARNTSQHPSKLTTMDLHHFPKDLEKYPIPFFLGEFEKKALKSEDRGSFSWLGVRLRVKPEAFHKSLNEIETLCEWLELRLTDAKYGDRKG